MAVRHEKVVLTLEDHFTTEMARAAAETALLDKQLKDLSKSSIRSRPAIRGTARDIDSVDKSARRADASINQLTGRLRLFADAAAILGPSLVPIGGIAVAAVTGLASQLGFAAIGAGTLVVAVQGVGDALKAVNEAALEPTTANIEKAQEAMAKIGPDARDFVVRFQTLRPVLTDLRDAAARGWFPGLTESLDSLERLAPRVAAIFERIGETGGNLIAEGAGALAGPEWADFLRFIETNAPQALDELGRTVGNFIKSMANMWMEFDPLNDDFSTWLLEQSRAFEEWSDGLSETEGFQEFVEYIRTNGPKVADAMGALGTALVEITEALAPLGGPSLKIIETFADVIGAIADSDLGTPIMAGVAALALYNRTLQVTAALQTRLTGSTALSSSLAAGGILGATKTGATGLRQTTADLRTYGALRSQVLARTTAETERMNAALARSKPALAGLAKGGAVLGGLTLATTELGDSFGGTAAQMALMGAGFGPWGAAAGAAIGTIMQLKDANKAFEDSLLSVRQAIEAGDVAGGKSALARTAQDANDFASKYDARTRLREKGFWGAVNPFGRSAVDNVLMIKNEVEGIFGDSDVEEHNAKVAEASAELKELESSLAAAELAERGMSQSLIATADAAGVSASALQSSITVINARTTAAAGAFDAETQWRQALKAAAEQAKKTNAGIQGSSDAALANRAALAQLRDAWANQRDAMVANGESADAVAKRYKVARAAFIDTARDMGVPEKAAKRLADTMLAIPEKKAAKITVDAGGALSTITEVDRRIKALKDRSLWITVRQRTAGGASASAMDERERRGDPFTGWQGSGSSGGFTGLGGKYDPAGIVHRGEVVIPQELVRRDKSLLMSRYGHLPGMDELPGMASGGLAGGKKGKPGKNAWAFLGWDMDRQVEVSLKGFIKSLEESKSALEDEISARNSLAESLSSEVAGKLTSDLFGATDIWSKGGTFTDVMAKLAGDIAAGGALQANIATLSAKGLSGGALQALLAQGDLATIGNFAALSAQQLAQYQQQYAVRASLGASVGGAAAEAAYNVTALNAASQAQADQVAAEIRTLTQITRQSAKSQQKGRSKAKHKARRG